MRGVVPFVITHKLCDDQPRLYRTTNYIDTVFQMLPSQVLGQDTTRRTFTWHRPTHIYLMSHT